MDVISNMYLTAHRATGKLRNVENSITLYPKSKMWLRLDTLRVRLPLAVALLLGVCTGVVVTRNDGAVIAAGDSGAVTRARGSSRFGIGPFFARHDTAGYVSVAPLAIGRDTVARLVIVRNLTGGGGADLIAGLVGRDVS